MLGLYYTKKREHRNAVVHFEKALERTKDPGKKQEIKNLLKKVSKRYAQEKKEAEANN
jgi:hypothetical protein